MEDNYKFKGDGDVDSIYGGARDGRQGFSRFLRRAESRPGLLPPWWTAEKAAECMKFGTKRGEWSELACAIEKSDIVEHYGNQNMPMMLRMFAEQVYDGKTSQSAQGMLSLQLRLEDAGPGSGMQILNMDASRLF